MVIVANVEKAHAEGLEIESQIEAILQDSGDSEPVQQAGDVNWVFWIAKNVWNRNKFNNQLDS